MLQTEFDNNKKYPALNVYNEETYINGVSRPSLSIEIDGESVDTAELYQVFEDIKYSGNITVSNGIAEDVFAGYVLPISFKVDFKEIERETLVTPQVMKKVITLVVATKTATEIKAEPTNTMLAVSSAEIFELRERVKTLKEQLMPTAG